MDIDHFNAPGPDDPDPDYPVIRRASLSASLPTSSEDSEFDDLDDPDYPLRRRAPSPTSSEEYDEIVARSRRRRRNVAIMACAIVTTAMEIVSSISDKQDYHTSILTGQGWVLELLNGHPRRIQSELGVSHHVFDLLLSNLHRMGYKDSRHVKVEEQLAIFLYTCVTGLSTRHVGERLQRAGNTISK
jgi:hypothetical protein